MSIVKTFSEFEAQKLNEEIEKEKCIQLLYEGEYIDKPTRSATELETYMKETRDKITNQEDYFNKLSSEHITKIREIVKKTIGAVLPEEISIRPDEITYWSFPSINFYMNVYNEKFATLHIDGISSELVRVERDTNRWIKAALDTNKWVKAALDKTYLSCCTTDIYLDTPQVEHLENLGKLAKLFGSKSSKPLIDFYTQTNSINVPFYDKTKKELESVWELKKDYNFALDEYTSIEWKKIFKVGLEFNMITPYIEDLTKYKFGAPKYAQIVNIIVTKIKPENADLIVVTDDGKEFEVTWNNLNVYKTWLNFSAEAAAFVSPWKLGK